VSYSLTQAIQDLHVRFDLPPATLDVAQDLRDIAPNPGLVVRRRILAGWYGDAIDHYLSAVRRAAAALSWCDACGEVIVDAYSTDDEICGGGDGPGFFLHSTCGAVCASRSLEDRREIYQGGRHRGRHRVNYLLRKTREDEAGE
jgi:hypothetical protein